MRKLGVSISGLLVLVHIALAQESHSQSEQDELLALASKLAKPSLAYNAVVGERLRREANFLSERLNLPMQRPIDPSNTTTRVSAPWFNKAENTNTNLSKPDRIRSATFFASGVIESGRFSFSLGGPENRRYVHREKIKNENSILDLYPELAKTPSLIDTNGAYQLSTQWLTSISVDVAQLEKNGGLSFFQHFFWGKPEDLPKDQWTYSSPSTTNKTMLPIYDVKWSGVTVTILGTTKELLDLRIENGSYLSRPPMVITNAFELNSSSMPPVRHIERRS